MRNIFTIILTLTILIGCKTDEPQNPPTVVTLGATDVTLKNSTLSGEVTEEGYSAATDRGFVFSDKNNSPSLSDTKVQSGYGKGAYSVVLNKLPVNTKYYFRAYATNSKGTSYGVVQSFTTTDYSLASLTTEIPKNITFNSVEISGNISNEGGGSVTERGFCFGLNPLPTTRDNKLQVSSKGLGAFALVIVNLKENTKYYIRSYAVNEKGTSYGNEQSFSTPLAPALRDTKTIVVEVKSNTGRIWMDRNLGASQVATNSKDEKAYGDLYQWGRGADGHQLRNSLISRTESVSNNPGNGNFILAVTGDWRNPPNDNLWQGVKGTNNPCPIGFRIPTEEEWNQERLTWLGGYNSEAAFASPLKLTMGGVRTSELPSNIGLNGLYWSSTTSSGINAKLIGFTNLNAGFAAYPRSLGSSIRCIKN
jgi:uncharacterized protein (TIGR02145 family)